MKTRYVLFFMLLFQGVLSGARAEEAQGCGDESDDCLVCINNAIRQAKDSVKEEEDKTPSDKSKSMGK